MGWHGVRAPWCPADGPRSARPRRRGLGPRNPDPPEADPPQGRHVQVRPGGSESHRGSRSDTDTDTDTQVRQGAQVRQEAQLRHGGRLPDSGSAPGGLRLTGRARVGTHPTRNSRALAEATRASSEHRPPRPRRTTPKDEGSHGLTARPDPPLRGLGRSPEPRKVRAPRTDWVGNRRPRPPDPTPRRFHASMEPGLWRGTHPPEPEGPKSTTPGLASR